MPQAHEAPFTRDARRGFGAPDRALQTMPRHAPALAKDFIPTKNLHQEGRKWRNNDAWRKFPKGGWGPDKALCVDIDMSRGNRVPPNIGRTVMYSKWPAITVSHSFKPGAPFGSTVERSRSMPPEIHATPPPFQVPPPEPSVETDRSKFARWVKTNFGAEERGGLRRAYSKLGQDKATF